MSKRQKKRSSPKSAYRSWSRARVYTIIAVFTWLLLSGFGYVWCRVQVVKLGYLLSEDHRMNTRLLNDNKKLHLELARLKAPERVERIAREQLGLKHPSKSQIVVLK